MRGVEGYLLPGRSNNCLAPVVGPLIGDILSVCLKRRCADFFLRKTVCGLYKDCD